MFIKNCNSVLWFSLNWLRFVGFLVPDELTGFKKMLHPFYFFFWFMFTVGIINIGQSVFLIQVWGDVAQMTRTTFILFTNLALSTKIINVKLKRNPIQAIIDEGDFELRTEKRAEGRQIIKNINNETIRLLCLYVLSGIISVPGFAVTVEKNQLPFPARFPYDVSKFPAYQLTFVYQIISIIGAITMNISLDLLVASLIAICRGRFQLLNLSLRTLCKDIRITHKLLTIEEEKVVSSRLRRCVLLHQTALESAALIEKSFTATILAQFMVSVIIICTSAYQLAEANSSNTYWIITVATYLVTMLFQVYFYCSEADKLTEESSLVADAAYECPWYSFPVSLKRALLNMMVRSRRVVNITAGGFATLSLICFVSIARLSYSFFTVLTQME